jgi:hypothetical protein
VATPVANASAAKMAIALRQTCCMLRAFELSVLNRITADLQKFQNGADGGYFRMEDHWCRRSHSDRNLWLDIEKSFKYLRARRIELIGIPKENAEAIKNIFDRGLSTWHQLWNSPLLTNYSGDQTHQLAFRYTCSRRGSIWRTIPELRIFRYITDHSG